MCPVGLAKGLFSMLGDAEEVSQEIGDIHNIF